MGWVMTRQLAGSAVISQGAGEDPKQEILACVKRPHVW